MRIYFIIYNLIFMGLCLLGYTLKGALAYGKVKGGPFLLFDNPKFGGEYKSRRFKIIYGYSRQGLGNYIMIKNYYYLKSKPKNKIMVAYYQGYKKDIIKKDFTWLQKF